MPDVLELEEGPSPDSLCLPLIQGEEVVGTICYSPQMYEVSRTFHRTSFCFHCRKVTKHFQVLRDSIKPTYWGPTIAVKCENCDMTDGDLFPGREREYEG